MRYPEGHKQEVRERIVREAAKALRERGLDGISVPDLMKRAGLTHGGFYSHFANRDELVADAVRAAGAETAEGVFSDNASVKETFARYLSPEHVKHPGHGCVVAALGSDGSRQPAPVRQAFATVARGLISLVDSKLRPRAASKRGPSDEALRVAATMVGAVVLARLVDDPALARRLLEAARSSV